MMNLLQRARESGRCPPSFVNEENMTNEDGFETQMLQLLGSSGFSLSSDSNVPSLFLSLMKKASGVAAVPGSDDARKKVVLELRRVLILALVGATPKSNPSLDPILEAGYLQEVNRWLDDILSGSVGGVDLLLHLLKNIADLPVTTNLVKTSGLGKAVGSIEKHRICSGTPNEGPVKEKVAMVKDHWKASVKARKITDGSNPPKPNVSTKREVSDESASPSAKRAKVESPKPSSSFSSLLKKMSSTDSRAQSSSTMSASTTQKLNVALANGLMADTAATVTSPRGNTVSPATAAAKKKKQQVRVKWADHFGGALEDSRLIEGENIVPAAQGAVAESWSDRKKRDREKEKKLLLTMKKAKLLDDDVEPADTAIAGMKPSVPWKMPALLPELPEASKPQLNSSEIPTQNERMKTSAAAKYSSDSDVPSSPAPLSDIEVALDMTAQSSATVVSLPFFASAQPEVAAPPPEPTPHVARQPQQDYSIRPPLPAASSGATPEFVQSLGLPLYLIGQDTKALQTLASSPGLLNSLVDSTGMYDQARLLSLVQTLSGAPATAAAPPPPVHMPPYAPPVPPAAPSPYGPSGGFNSSYGGSTSFGAPRSSGMRKSSDEGNLHVSGYGPTTTQADLIALFSPYVVVDEVVMKGTFAFVNTSDPFNAQRAREALSGTLLNGQLIRINQAQRKGRDSSSGPPGPPSSHSNPYGPSGAVPAQPFQFGTPVGAAPPNHRAAPPPPPFMPPAQPASIDDVRDSRGNAPTKNLFVAGYGPGTTELQIRQIFGQHCNVIGVVLKGNFTFVNTSSREDAVKSREMLQGNMINGGPLRINFAKETGRLGTSFDLTYNQQSGPNARREPGPPGPGPAVSYYGR